MISEAGLCILMKEKDVHSASKMFIAWLLERERGVMFLRQHAESAIYAVGENGLAEDSRILTDAALIAERAVKHVS